MRTATLRRRATGHSAVTHMEMREERTRGAATACRELSTRSQRLPLAYGGRQQDAGDHVAVAHRRSISGRAVSGKGATIDCPATSRARPCTRGLPAYSEHGAPARRAADHSIEDRRV